jgi:BirA family biotin operon repressor/biotin-[acetyl-CoA-carboxylase] ligase
LRTLGNKIIRYETVTSTNQVLKELMEEGLGNGTLVTAKVQTAGRGRLDRTWESPEGGLWMSILLELDDSFDINRIGLISLIAGSSVTTAILMEFGVDAGVKWPNDVLISGRKVCGILAEMHIFQDKRFVILGIGINANNKMTNAYDFSDSSTSICEEFGKKVEMSVLENTILEELDFRMELLKNAVFDKILEDWRELSVTLGRRVNVVTPSGEIRGLAKDIDIDGSLLIDMDGRIEKVLVGDCRHLD